MPASASGCGECPAPLGLQAPQALLGCPSMTAMHLQSPADLGPQGHKVCRGLQDRKVTRERPALLGHQGSFPLTSSNWEPK